MFQYQISGWTLTTPFPLPYLLPAPAAAAAEITLRHGAVPPLSPPVRTDRDGIRIGADGGVLIEAPGRGRIAVTDGTTITVDPVPGTAWPDLYSWLFGPALGAICHQRRMFPLHACGLRIGTAAVAIVGNRRAGKSTLAMALIQRGYRLLADDVLVVDPQTALARPCFPAVSLWNDSRAALQITAAGPSSVADTPEKRTLSMPDRFDRFDTPLTALVHLQVDPDAAAPAMTHYAPVQAAAVLDAMAYRPSLTDALQGRQRILSAAVDLARRVPVWHLRRTPAFSDLPAMLTLLDRVVAAHAGADSGGD